MPLDVSPAVVYPLFALYLLAGLVAYERWGERLGGVLAFPYLVVYSLRDVAVLLLFGLAATVTYCGGEVIHRATLIYGRRMLVAYLALSLMASFAFNALINVSVSGVFLPILPGLFAYNLHREGRPIWRTALFVGALVVTLLVTFALLAIFGASPASGNVAPFAERPVAHRTTPW